MTNFLFQPSRGARNPSGSQPKVLAIDKLSPEDIAMLQALYSRSSASVISHLEKVEKTGSGKFMETYYVGYNHASIGDCGTTTLFFENVSTLAAKAIQDWALYSGQETSTRFLDMSQQPIVDPIGTFDSAAIQRRWMGFYTNSQEAVAAEVRRRYPRLPSEDEKNYEGAVKARTFDILRGFLPAGICTQLSWHTNLRQAKEHLEFLQFHPCEEVAMLGRKARDILAERYTSSGFTDKLDDDGNLRYPEMVEWQRRVGADAYTRQHVPSQLRAELRVAHGYDAEVVAQLSRTLRERPKGATVPHRVNALSSFHAVFPLDFGSFRDIQRHRAGVTFMPLLTSKGGFERWYIDQLPESLRTNAFALVAQQDVAIHALKASPEESQYYCGLGHRVPCDVTYGLASAIYVTELRSTKFIHPTLRRAIHECAKELRYSMEAQDWPYYADTAPDDWDVRRGGQTITER